MSIYIVLAPVTGLDINGCPTARDNLKFGPGKLFWQALVWQGKWK
jgi:hypothetical protein